MAFSDEICKLVIENVELLQEAPSVIDEIEVEIFKAINTRIEDFFKDKDGWKDDDIFTYFEDDGETAFSPIDWPKDEDDFDSASYKFDYSGEMYCLAALVGKDPIKHFGLFFGVNHSFFKMNKTQWKKFLATQYGNKPILKESGVVLDGELLCIPIIIDPKLMAEEYPDFDSCLQPVDDALEILMKVNPQIDEIVKELEKSAPATN